MFTSYQIAVPSSGAGNSQVFPFEGNSYNSSHIQELYHNLPQLSRAIVLPFSYRSNEDNHIEAMHHPHLPTSSKVHFHKYENPIKFQEYPRLQKNDETSVLFKRDGNGHGWGWGEVGGGWHAHSKGNSPALSALALLGFMFFLNLIQTSLQNNRAMLAMAAMNATPAPAAAASGRHARSKRQVDFGDPSSKVEALPRFFNEGAQTSSVSASPTFSTRPSGKRVRINGKFDRPSSNSKFNVKRHPVNSFKSTSMKCSQLLACKLGRTIYGSLDTTTRILVRMLSAGVISRIPKTKWTGRLMRALDSGWSSQKECEKLFQKCRLHNLFSSHNITTMRK